MAQETRYPFFVNQTQRAFELFKQWNESKANGINFIDDKPIESPYCRIHDAFDSYHRKIANDPFLHIHNCIGCNLSATANEIYYFLETNRNCDYSGYYIKTFTLHFYTHIENLAVIFKELGYDWGSFPTFQLIRAWANFFKHPKSFMFIHHPTYHIETDPDKPNFMINEIIDSNFVREFYHTRADNDKLFVRLGNKEDCKVFFPDLALTIKALCFEFEEFIKLITSNEVYLEKLGVLTSIKRTLNTDDLD